MSGADPQPTKLDSRLSEHSRWLVGVVGAILIAIGVGLFVNPPSTRSFPPQCAEEACVAEVDQSPDALSTVLVGLGALLLLVGVNGRQIVGLKFAGAEASLASEAKDAEAKASLAADVATEAGQPAVRESEGAPDLAPGEGRASVISIGEADLVRVEPAQVPSRVLTDLASAGVGVRASADLDWGARLLGKGNHPWYVRLRNGSVYKVSYGGQGKTAPTIAEIT